MRLPERRPAVTAGGKVWACLLVVGTLLGPALSLPPAPAPRARAAEPTALDPRARALARLGAPAWHARGWRGEGVTVAVIDSGFDGYREHLGGALPDKVEARSFRRDRDLEAGDSGHGVLCAEVLHAVAPGARLLLANWEPEHPQTFLDAVRWARRQGARILSCSIVMPSWSDGEGGGPIHEALDELLRGSGRDDEVLFFAAAGNTASRHWGGPFRPATTPPGEDPAHEWEPGVTENALDPWGEGRVSVELCVPFGESPVPRFRAVVTDQDLGREVVRADTPAAPRLVGHSCAVVCFLPAPGHSYSLRVEKVGDLAASDERGTPGRFRVTVLGGELRCSSRWGSIPFPGDGRRVVAVGALDADGERRPYSSCGALDARPVKPDLVAAVPFPSLWRARPFSGTSAAAPQAAGLAALVWSRHPGWTAGQVRQALYRAARPPRAGAPAAETGHGRVALPE